MLDGHLREKVNLGFGCNSVAEHLPRMCKVLDSIPSKQTNKEDRKEGVPMSVTLL